MKKKIFITIVLLLFSIVIAGVLFFNARKNNIVKDDYFAVISNGFPDFCFYDVYLYLNDDYSAKYVVTVTPTNIAGGSFPTKIIKRGNLDRAEGIFNIEVKYGGVTLSAHGGVKINKDIPATLWHPEYKKGQTISEEELWGLIAIN